MRFRPCIDLHNGVVKQIVGGTLQNGQEPETNFVSSRSPAWYAQLYRRDNLTGGHIIRLGKGNDMAAREALAAWPGGMQLGGGIDAENAAEWIAAGASHVIVTSCLFRDGALDHAQLERLVAAVGRERLVFDLSCRRRQGEYYIVTDRWQTFTKEIIDASLLGFLADYCAEFLVHAVDMEGLCAGVEVELVEKLGEITPVPTTYAGGIYSWQDLRCIAREGRGRLDFTVGSSLDIFGGKGFSYRQLAAGEFGQASRHNRE